MRLNEDQVKQAILNSDRDVREAAVYYFSRSYSQDAGIIPAVADRRRDPNEVPEVADSYAENAGLVARVCIGKAG